MKKIIFFIASIAIMISVTSCGQKSDSSKIKTIVTEDSTKFTFDILTIDEGVVINGTKWATHNIAAPGTFAASSEDAGMFYQWNNKKAWAITGNEVADWDSSISAGNTWTKSNDPSPTGWHIPTDEEFRTLFDSDNVSSEWTTLNGVNGGKFTDKATGNSIFLPAAGYRSGSDGALNLVDMQGNYWMSTTSCSDCSFGVYICDYNMGMNDGEDRDCAFNVRSVAD